MEKAHRVEVVGVECGPPRGSRLTSSVSAQQSSNPQSVQDQQSLHRLDARPVRGGTRGQGVRLNQRSEDSVAERATLPR
jgi:hypothetical protein